MICRLRLTFSKSEVNKQCIPGYEHEKWNKLHAFFKVTAFCFYHARMAQVLS